MRTITFLHQFDPAAANVGGIENYILSFIANAPSGYRFQVIGVTANKHALFQWKTIKIKHKAVQVYAVCTVKQNNLKPILPITLRYSLGLLRARFKIKLNGILLLQRPEYFLPLYASKIKKILFIHNDLEKHHTPGSSESLWACFPNLYNFLFRFVLAKSLFIFSVNRNSVKTMHAMSSNVANKVDFAPTWADPSKFFRKNASLKLALKKQIAKEYHVSHEKPWLIFAGRFQKQKNIDFLIQSFACLNDDSLLFMAGTGNEDQTIKQLVLTLGLTQRVVFLGKISHYRIADFLHAANAYVSSSHYEGMSIALLEALQTGTPVVTTPTGESRLIIQNGINGMVTDGWDKIEFADAINTVLAFKDNRSEKCLNSVTRFNAENTISNILGKVEQYC